MNTFLLIHDAKARSLVARMTVDEKIGQLCQAMPPAAADTRTAEDIRSGRIGSLINVTNPDDIRSWQRIAIEESRLGIPLLIGRDVIHGFRTILPIPLGQAATWNPELIAEGATVAAREARSIGIHWTFAPMIDIARDPRWGRVAESFGEDPFLTSTCAEAAIRGFQGHDSGQITRIAACAKHFAGYGASEAGRDYNSTWIPDQALWETHFPPFLTAVNTGVATIMAAFNDLNGIPCSANRALLQSVLRDTWNFPGFVVSDWDSVRELVTHGLAEDDKQAALLCARAGIDMEMNSPCFRNHLAALIASGDVDESDIDEKVIAILRVKHALGLFENPYPPEDAVEPPPLTNDSLQMARHMATESFVLLKNENNILPLTHRRIALIGPLADQAHEQLGTWSLDGRKEDSITPRAALEELAQQGAIELCYTPGLTFSRDRDESGFAAALAAAHDSDLIVFVGGEEAVLSGEARCRTDISLPGAQESLLHALAATGKPVVLVIMAGRPLVLENILPHVSALLYLWHPGTMAGPALCDVLTGITEPGGRLPVSFPRSVGQIPVHYSHRNTGRPKNEALYKFIDDIPVGEEQSSLGHSSFYLDESNEPRFAFGEGSGYTTFAYGPVECEHRELQVGQPVTVQATLTNTGNRTGTEVVQLYLRDLCASITRPVRELKGFQKITLSPGESTTVRFILTPELLSFPGPDGVLRLEPGDFHVWIGGNSKTTNHSSFTLLL